MTIVIVLLTLVVALLGVLVAGLLRSHAVILRRLHELGVGLEDDAVPRAADDGRPEGIPAVHLPEQAPDVLGTDPSGGAVGVPITGVEHDTILAFLSTSCLTCETFWETFSRPEEVALPPDTRLVIVAKDADQESPSELARLAPPGLTVVLSSQTWLSYDVPGSPFFVHVEGRSGRVRGSGTAGDWERVARLLELATGDASYTAADLPSGRAPKAAADAAREREIDHILRSAGIGPGDPSLYPPLDTDAADPSATGRA